MDRHGEDATGRRHRAGTNRQRQRVLELVREHDEPVDAAELAAKLGLHTTTVRFHLDALCDDGVVERTRITRTGVGRPRTGYHAVRERLDYRTLAEILALELGDTADERRRRAEAVGRRWAARIGAEDGAGQRVTDLREPGTVLEERAAAVAKVFDRMGFGPELAPPESSATGKRRTIELHSCPVRELARAHPEVACAMHRGTLQGLLKKAAAREGDSADPVLRAELEPFVEPELCRVRVTAND
ncbi:transcriptional regulator [Mycobacterium alsense]|uniref:helix-turn-helix transcriptional regulator n=1 Tax=Mycobacterium alsense TaxID=324058 RepID=UPI0007FF3DB3|nr:HTH domain-containing protein [Mycobacterium alsense]OBI99433.1 transcriptional regulator [Mycobacterium alsense]